MKRRSFAYAACAALVFIAAQTGWAGDSAADYPDRPIRIIVTVPPGGAADFVARTVSAGLSSALHQNVIVENRAGANGSIGASDVARAAPDGYTLLNATISTHGIGPYFANLPYDPFKDFVPVGEIAEFPLILAVNAKLPIKSIDDMIALAKEKKGQLSFASAGIGSAPHLAGELFQIEAKVKMLHVPYKGSAPGAADVAAGRVDAMFDGVPSLLPFIKAHKVRPIAALSVERNAVLPNLPTFTKLGYPGMVASLWYGLMAPAGTPKPIIAKLNAALDKTLSNPELRKKLEAGGANVKVTTPDQFWQFVLKDHARWGDVIEKAHVPTGK